MKFSKIYSNKNAQFHNIEFYEGLNVVLAEITDKSRTEKDTHNLGKTLLIRNSHIPCIIDKPFA